MPVRPARDEIVYVGAEPSEAVISIDGVLAYISGDQPWIIERSTARRRPVAEVGGLDRRVFDLSADGRQLLFTRATEDENDPVFSNELWAVLNTSARTPQAVQLFPNDVLSAQWVPGRANTLSYSTAVPTSDQIGWRAYNDLFTVELDPQTGEAISDSVEQIVEQNALGAYAYWGRRFLWSPSGERLAWANADSVGTVDLERGEFVPLLSFAEYATLLPLVWVPTLSWSEDGLLITTAHGAPYGTESREDSIVFDTAVLDAENELVLPTFRAKSGIWSSPSYSPLIEHADGRTETLVAYFQAREPLNSLGSTYDLWIADADGSNARKVFPGPDDPGQDPARLTRKTVSRGVRPARSLPSSTSKTCGFTISTPASLPPSRATGRRRGPAGPARHDPPLAGLLGRAGGAARRRDRRGGDTRPAGSGPARVGGRDAHARLAAAPAAGGR